MRINLDFVREKKKNGVESKVLFVDKFYFLNSFIIKQLEQSEMKYTEELKATDKTVCSKFKKEIDVLDYKLYNLSDNKVKIMDDEYVKILFLCFYITFGGVI